MQRSRKDQGGPPWLLQGFILPSSFQLRSSSSPQWLSAVLADFDAFLVDHAANERKASATALNFVVRYPDRRELIAPMIALAIEELQHFQAVYALLAQRGIELAADERDLYMAGLLKQVRSSGAERLLDRLVVGSVVEARGCERFGLIADALEPGPLKDLYLDISASERRHQGLYLELAECWFEVHEIDSRLEFFLNLEAQVLEQLPHLPRLH
ncbi:MAG: tRNA-(ms[2]io[6]A)-hydroxylase [Rickettsiales bacterium]|nr:tRNA-(ms[2]io[6]A)-hydroxylase [Rickettsiales bacterium]|tara:strand:+ start:4472 stop:5110 length:639 start_codon:yes stop_codon:yes gene_type:complete